MEISQANVTKEGLSKLVEGGGLVKCVRCGLFTSGIYCGNCMKKLREAAGTYGNEEYRFSLFLKSMLSSIGLTSISLKMIGYDRNSGTVFFGVNMWKVPITISLWKTIINRIEQEGGELLAVFPMYGYVFGCKIK